ncbi:MAG TPA: UDP-glucuronic acid decarboxylase family protein [Gemmatimonadales bacterium]|nr:UDP-glucuronic acid decarboxylase family protein [Gemmatimonadales bacterium]
MRVVVTGAAGFLGSHLSDRFLADGHTVVGVDNFLTGRPVNIAHLETEPRFTFVETDVSDGLDIAGAIDGVLHFASPASPPDYQAFPVETLRVGSAGTLHALALAQRTGARFFMASTSEVYGDPLVHPQPESYWGNVSSTGPRSMYDEAKRFSEAAVMTYRRHHGVDTRIVRIFNTYGPRMRPEDGRVVSNFVVQALRGSPLTVYGDGSQTRSFCYVSDLIEGITRLFHSAHQEPTNIGNPVEFTMLELAEQVLAETGSTSKVEFLPLPADDPKVRQPDITLAQDVLGWNPTVPLREGLRQTVAWFRQEVGA